MTAPRLRKIPTEVFANAPPEVQDALETLLEYLNPFMTDVGESLDGGLTWGNFRATEREVNVTANFDTVKITTPEIGAKARNVIVTRAWDITNRDNPRAVVAPTVAWENTNEGILIRAASGLLEGTKYRLRLLITA